MYGRLAVLRTNICCSGGGSRCLYFRLPFRRRGPLLWLFAAIPQPHCTRQRDRHLQHLVSPRRVVDRPSLCGYIICIYIYMYITDMCMEYITYYYLPYYIIYARLYYAGTAISVKNNCSWYAEALVHYYTSPYLFTVWGAYFLLGAISIPYRLQHSLQGLYNNLL